MKHISLRTHEVQNIIAGRQTRLSRPVKEAIGWDQNWQPMPIKEKLRDGIPRYQMRCGSQYSIPFFKCPFGKVGDIIACKETWVRCCEWDGEGDMPPLRLYYKAAEDWKLLDWHDEEKNEPVSSPKWRSPVTMPLSACRLWLRVKEIRCERIQDITEEGAKAEGVEQNRDGSWHDYLEPTRLWQDCAKASYQSLHMKTYGPDSWERNDWHWILIVEKTDKQ